MGVEFVGGLLWGLIGDNHLNQVETCLKDAGTFLSDAEKAVTDVSSGSWTSAASDVKDAVHEIEAMFSSGGDCTSFAKDIAAITEWASVGWLKLAETVAKEEDNLELDLLMLPELAAGFVYGMVGDNH